MKKYLFYVLGLVIIALGYLLLKKKNTTSSTTDTPNPSSGLGDIFGFLNGTNSNTTTDSTGTNTTGNTGTTPDNNIDSTPVNTPITGPTEQLSFRYNGQLIYNKYNGVAHPIGTIGYLANGTLLYTVNITFDSTKQEYTDKSGGTATSTFNSAGVNLSSSMGSYFVNGGYAIVYSQKQNTYIGNIQNGFGFLANGSVVYYGIMYAGETNESTYYYS